MQMRKIDFVSATRVGIDDRTEAGQSLPMLAGGTTVWTSCQRAPDSVGPEWSIQLPFGFADFLPSIATFE